MTSGPVQYVLPSGGKLIVERKGVDAQRGLGGGAVEKADQTFTVALGSVRDVLYTEKYFACGCVTTIALVDCSGSS